MKLKGLLATGLVLFSCRMNAQKFTSGIQVNMVSYHAEGAVNTSSGATTPYFEATELKASGFNLNGTFGYNPMIYKFNSDLSLGASANIGIGYLFTPKLEGLDGSYIFDFPEYITLRYGKNAVEDSDKDVGFAIGAGYDLTLNRLPYRGPSVMAEISFGSVAIRLNSNIKRFTYYSYFTSEGAKPTLSVLPFGVQLVVAY